MITNILSRAVGACHGFVVTFNTATCWSASSASSWTCSTNILQWRDGFNMMSVRTERGDNPHKR